jgi:ATP-dependent Clp protease ATP-binding subunit ClpC
MTKIPLSKINESETKKLLKMEKEISGKVVGQDEAIKIISAAARRARVGLNSKNRPLGSFIFLGPTGVGKTELAKRLAEFMFGDANALVRIDMSDFMEKHNVSRLVGAPPGYIGYDEGGLLTERIRKRPYSVVLLDEIEKAHPDVFNILLQVLEEGELADNLGHIISFRDTIIIMTSNVGAREIYKDSNFGFNMPNSENLYKEIKTSAMNELKRVFNPEFLNRVDEIVVFKPLEKEDLKKIIDIMFEETKTNIKQHRITISITDEAKELIIKENYDKKFGARTLRRAIQKDITDPLTLEILAGNFKKGDKIVLDVENGKLIFKSAKKDKKNLEENTIVTNSSV